MKITVNLILFICLIDVVYLRRSFIYANGKRWPIKVKSSYGHHGHMQHQSNFVTSSSVQLNFDNFEQNQMVKQLINELTNNLHNKTLINKIRLNLNDDETVSNEQLVSNLTNNLANRNPLMSEYLDEKLKNYLIKMQQQSLNQTIDLMDLLRQFNEIVSIPRLNFTNADFELINNRTELPNDSTKNKQDDFVLIYSKNSTDLNSTKLSRMEFLTDTLISLLIGKLIGLKIGFFAGKLISNVPFSFSNKRGCCNTNTWPSDSPGMQPTDASIVRNQFISMKKNNDKSKEMKNRNKQQANDDDWLLENEEEDWKSLDEDEYEEKYVSKNDKTTTKRPSVNKQTVKNKYSINDEFSSVYTKYNNYDKQIEESLEDLDNSANKAILNFKQYTNYHPIYSAIDGYSQYTTVNPTNFISSTNSLPEQATTIRHKNYMLLTG